MALDVGERRVGLALADTQVRIAVPYGYVERSDTTIQRIVEIMLDHSVDIVVVGYPRNQSGEATKQTEAVEAFARELADIEIDAELVFQDESLTSVEAEDILKARKQAYAKGEVDALAASLILQDYLEAH